MSTLLTHALARAGLPAATHAGAPVTCIEHGQVQGRSCITQRQVNHFARAASSGRASSAMASHTRCSGPRPHGPRD